MLTGDIEIVTDRADLRPCRTSGPPTAEAPDLLLQQGREDGMHLVRLQDHRPDSEQEVLETISHCRRR